MESSEGGIAHGNLDGLLNAILLAQEDVTVLGSVVIVFDGERDMPRVFLVIRDH